MISICADKLTEYRRRDACLPLRFYCWDGGQVYTQVFTQQDAGPSVPGVLLIAHGGKPADISAIGTDGDQVRVIARWQENGSDSQGLPPGAAGRWVAQGFVRREGRWEEMAAQIVSLQVDLQSRAKGLIETDALADVCVFVGGHGSVGSFVDQELAQAGVGHFILWDHDRVEVANVMRQNVSIADIGRRKTRVAMGRICYDKNPYAQVETHEAKITWDTKESVRQDVRKSAIVIGAVDNREPRSVLNELCVEEGKPLILMGADHRAYRLRIFFMRRPGIDPCYECFLMSLPAEVRDPGFSGLEGGEDIAYADYHVSHVMPGLSTDIAPLVTMTTKLCLNYLLQNEPTTLPALDEDLTAASLYSFVNRREPECGAGPGTRILAWYGDDSLRRQPACPVCGDFAGEVAKAHGISLAAEDLKKYERQAARE